MLIWVLGQEIHNVERIGIVAIVNTMCGKRQTASRDTLLGLERRRIVQVLHELLDACSMKCLPSVSQFISHYIRGGGQFASFQAIWQDIYDTAQLGTPYARSSLNHKNKWSWSTWCEPEVRKWRH